MPPPGVGTTGRMGPGPGLGPGLGDGPGPGAGLGVVARGVVTTGGGTPAPENTQQTNIWCYIYEKQYAQLQKASTMLKPLQVQTYNHRKY